MPSGIREFASNFPNDVSLKNSTRVTVSSHRTHFTTTLSSNVSLDPVGEPALRGLARHSKHALKLRYRFKEIGNQAVVCHLEDGGLLILIDRHDDPGVLHPR